MKKFWTMVACAAAIATAAPAQADDSGGFQVGTLRCEQTDRTNLVLWSKAEYTCIFKSATGKDEVYTGKINKIGVDLTISKVETMIWTVIAPVDRAEPGALSGTYVGASIDASVGVGVGARALVGGGGNSFTLQPVSVSGQEGVGAAAGIESFKLTSGE